MADDPEMAGTLELGRGEGKVVLRVQSQATCGGAIAADASALRVVREPDRNGNGVENGFELGRPRLQRHLGSATLRDVGECADRADGIARLVEMHAPRRFDPQLCAVARAHDTKLGLIMPT